MKYLAFILAATLCITACQKDEDPAPATPATTDSTTLDSNATTVQYYNGHWRHYARTGQAGIGSQERDTNFVAAIKFTRTADSLIFELDGFTNHNRYSFRKIDTTQFSAFKMYQGTMTFRFAGDSLYAKYVFRSSGTGGGYAEDYRDFNGRK